MADFNQGKPGSASRDTMRRAGAPIGGAHGEADGTRAVEEAKEVGIEIMGAVREGATSFFEEQRNRAANEVASFGEMLRRSARSLDQNRSTTVGRYADDAAEEITAFAERLRNRSLGTMANDLEDFARRWPAAFMAAVVGAGFLAGRFLISSASRPAPNTTPPMPHPARTKHEPVGGARHDFGAVGGQVSGGANAGYGGGAIGETR